MEFVVDKVAVGQVFSEYFVFPCQFSFHQLLRTHNLSSGAGIIGQLVADIRNGLSLILSHEFFKEIFRTGGGSRLESIVRSEVTYKV
jgi:hypothetical protein